jgi:putative iron-only hydrogenase system regulator
MSETMTVIGIVVDGRAERAPEVQEVITRYGEDIVCRMGVPSPSKENGLITLVFKGEVSAAERFYDELEGLSGVDAQMMRFTQ